MSSERIEVAALNAPTTDVVMKLTSIKERPLPSDGRTFLAQIRYVASWRRDRERVVGRINKAGNLESELGDIAWQHDWIEAWCDLPEMIEA